MPAPQPCIIASRSFCSIIPLKIPVIRSAALVPCLCTHKHAAQAENSLGAEAAGPAFAIYQVPQSHQHWPFPGQQVGLGLFHKIGGEDSVALVQLLEFGVWIKGVLDDKFLLNLT